jgi:hypothetical protein
MFCLRGLQALPWSIEQTQSFFQRKQAPVGWDLRSSPQGFIMLAIKRAQKIIKADITAPFSKLLANLIVSLETDQEFEIKQLFSLSYENFELVMEILKEWRIDRYYIGKAKTFALAYHANTITT